MSCNFQNSKKQMWEDGIGNLQICPERRNPPVTHPYSPFVRNTSIHDESLSLFVCLSACGPSCDTFIHQLYSLLLTSVFIVDYRCEDSGFLVSGSWAIIYNPICLPAVKQVMIGVFWKREPRPIKWHQHGYVTRHLFFCLHIYSL
jgi:hypothetical protein